MGASATIGFSDASKTKTTFNTNDTYGIYVAQSAAFSMTGPAVSPPIVGARSNLGWGLRYSSPQAGTITNCAFSSNAKAGLYVYADSKLKVRGSNFENSMTNGIYVADNNGSKDVSGIDFGTSQQPRQEHLPEQRAGRHLPRHAAWRCDQTSSRRRATPSAASTARPRTARSASTRSAWGTASATSPVNRRRHQGHRRLGLLVHHPVEGGALMSSIVMRALGTAVLAALLLSGRVAQARAGGEARDAFEEGAASFRLGQYQAAIGAWQRAYELRPDPVFLFNIAQAYRLAEDDAQALDFYRRYLAAAPTATNRAEVERRIEQLQAGTSPATVASADAGSFALPSSSPPPPAATGNATGVGSRARAVASSSAPTSGWRCGCRDRRPTRCRRWRSPFAATRSCGNAVDWRCGSAARVGYTFVREASATDHFVSLRLLPTLRVRLTARRWFLDATPAVGAEIIAGLPAGSPLLRAGADAARPSAPSSCGRRWRCRCWSRAIYSFAQRRRR